MTEYRSLLKKYMQHIGEYEGSDFLNHINSHMTDVRFSDEEEAVLRQIAGEIWGEHE